MNRIRKITDFGQSIWLDYIQRSLVTSGQLQHFIDEDGLRGMTSNPAIFEKAIGAGEDYKRRLNGISRGTDLDVKSAYETIAIEDIQLACDVMKQVYVSTGGTDGYVSLEVSPYLAHDTKETCTEARRLWKAVGRQNLMIKIPATPEGLPAIEEMIRAGLNINVTLIFSTTVYEQVAEAFLSGLEKRLEHGQDIRRSASVASFFVSRIDSAVDKKIDALLRAAPNAAGRRALEAARGRTAIANAKIAYGIYNDIVAGARWKSLAAAGAGPQRLLWASTGTKDPAYSDVLYVDELIGRDTVNTIPPATMDAFRDHGNPRASLVKGMDSAPKTMAALADLGIDFDEITDQLLADGVRLFSEAFEKLLAAIRTEEALHPV